jgi:hypothetical protein
MHGRVMGRPAACRALLWSLAALATVGCAEPRGSVDADADGFRVVTEIHAEMSLVPNPDDIVHEAADVAGPVLAAACQNYLRLLDDPGLIRSAELLDGEFDADRFVAVEQAVGQVGTDVSRVTDHLRAQEGESSLSDAQIESYLIARAQPPTPTAANRYVVYMTARTTTVTRIVRLRVPTERRRSDSASRTIEVVVELPDGSVVGIDERLCRPGDDD